MTIPWGPLPTTWTPTPTANVSIWSLDYYSRASGSATTLNSRGLIGTVLRLTFTRPLSDAGGNISFPGYEQGLPRFLVA